MSYSKVSALINYFIGAIIIIKDNGLACNNINSYIVLCNFTVALKVTLCDDEHVTASIR